MQQYAQMSEIELLRLAAAYDSLVGTAQDALRDEFARRGIEPPIVAEEIEVTSQPLVTLRRYRDLSEALVARSMLESAGIFCFLRDENFVRIDWGYSNFVGGIRLEVRAESIAETEALLNQPPERIAFAEGEEYKQPHCPRCGSVSITFLGSDRSAAVATTFLLGIPLPLGEETWRCDACGCRWADDGDYVSSESATST